MKICQGRELELPSVVNQETLMKCVIRSLMQQKEEEEKRMFERLNKEQDELKERLTLEKATRKAAAEERSRLRQLDEKANQNEY